MAQCVHCCILSSGTELGLWLCNGSVLIDWRTSAITHASALWFTNSQVYSEHKLLEDWWKMLPLSCLF